MEMAWPSVPCVSRTIEATNGHSVLHTQQVLVFLSLLIQEKPSVSTIATIVQLGADRRVIPRLLVCGTPTHFAVAMVAATAAAVSA